MTLVIESEACSRMFLGKTTGSSPAGAAKNLNVLTPLFFVGLIENRVAPVPGQVSRYGVPLNAGRSIEI